MNIPIVITTTIVILAFIAHTVAGTREALSTSPMNINEGDKPDSSSMIYKNWIQSMCAFQMITVDLFMLSIILSVILLTDLIPFEKNLTYSLSLLFLLWGISWLIQLAVLTQNKKNYVLLGQWIIWFLCSGLLYFGAEIM